MEFPIENVSDIAMLLTSVYYTLNCCSLYTEEYSCSRSVALEYSSTGYSSEYIIEFHFQLFVSNHWQSHSVHPSSSFMSSN